MPDSRQLFAARWHLDRVKELESDTEQFQHWRRHVLACGHPERDPATPIQSIDLTEFYTARLTGRRLWSPKNGEVLHDAASLLGRRTLADVEFDVRVIVHLDSTADRLRPLGYPKSVHGIPIPRTARRFHFLQATTRPTAAGATVGKYVVHYVNGQRQKIPLVYGENISQFAGPGVHLRQAELAWEVQSDRLSGNQAARLFQFTWTSPLPDQELVSIDFVSHLTEAAPFLVPLTVE